MKRITDYKRLKQYATAFKKGHGNLLVLVGRPGTGKTTVIRKAMGAKARYFRGRVSGFQLYRELWLHRDDIFILDDVANITRDPILLGLLKDLCETTNPKQVRWTSADWRLDLADDDKDEKKPPRLFTTRTRLVIITNDWRGLEEHIGALGDRGWVIKFEPTAAQVHKEAGKWFRDRQIYQFVGDHLMLNPQHGMRDYVHAKELKNAGMNWQREMLADWVPNEDEALVLWLLQQPGLSQKERIKRFVARTKKSRRTFFYALERLRERGGEDIEQLLHSCTHAQGAKVQPKQASHHTVKESQKDQQGSTEGTVADAWDQAGWK